MNTCIQKTHGEKKSSLEQGQIMRTSKAKQINHNKIHKQISGLPLHFFIHHNNCLYALASKRTHTQH
jgi:hypothetical protein